MPFSLALVRASFPWHQLVEGNMEPAGRSIIRQETVKVLFEQFSDYAQALGISGTHFLSSSLSSPMQHISGTHSILETAAVFLLRLQQDLDA
jgi:hypothetical protein